MQQGSALLSLDETTPQMLREAITDARAWKRETLSPEAWLVPFPQACFAELDAVVIFTARPTASASEAGGVCAHGLCERHGTAPSRCRHSHVGFAVVDRVPVERYSIAEPRHRVVTQPLWGKWWPRSGMGPSCDVQDSGKPFGHGVRRSVTNLEQPDFTDGGWLWMPRLPLVCSSSRLASGTGRLVSLCTVHNELRRCHPDLLARLYRPFWWDRQAEHAPDDVCVSRHPVYQYDGHTLMARYYDDYVCHGSRLAGEALDTAGGSQRLCEPSWMPRRTGWNSVSSRDSSVHQQPSVRPRPHRLWRQACGHRATCCGSGTVMRYTPDLEGQVDTVWEIAPWIYKLWCTRP